MKYNWVSHSSIKAQTSSSIPPRRGHWCRKESMYYFDSIKHRHQPQTCLYSSARGTTERVKHKFDVCWLQTHVKDVTVWGRNHRIDKRSFQGSTRYIFSNAKVQRYDKCMVTTFEHISLFLPWDSGTVTKRAWYEHTQLVSRFQLKEELPFQCLLWKITPAKIYVNITADSQRWTSCWAAPLPCHTRESCSSLSPAFPLHRLCSHVVPFPRAHSSTVVGWLVRGTQQ